MVRIEQVAEAALRGDSLTLRSLVQDFLREHPDLACVPEPEVHDATILAASASLLELLAMRRNQMAPRWTRDIGSLDRPVFLVKAAATMKRLRALCEAETPAPLRKRGFYAPANFLEFA